MGAPYDFAGEEFLLESPPDYPMERIWLAIQLGAAFVFWIIFVPTVCSLGSVPVPEEKPAAAPVTKVSAPVEKKESKKSKKKAVKAAAPAKPVEIPKSAEEEMPPPEISIFTVMACAFCCMISMALLLFFASPDNRYTARGVFAAPMFTQDECSFLVDMAETVAQRNYQLAHNHSLATELGGPPLGEAEQGFLVEPVGWQKKRHGNFPTTDLNVVTDPFDSEDLKWIKDKLDARLSPILQRLYGIPIHSIRAADIFLVRYDGDRQAHLTKHTDTGDVTFTALLSDGFEGGGTRYWNEETHEPFADVLPPSGQMTLFTSRLYHEGMQVTKGRRYLLIGFLNVDRVNIWTGAYTGLSWFASWGGLNWGAQHLADGYESAFRNQENGIQKWTNSKYARGFFLDMYAGLRWVADKFCRHHYTPLVDNAVIEPYLEALDNAHAQRKGIKEANWFSGQQINLDWDGTVNSYWETRAEQADKFEAVPE